MRGHFVYSGAPVLCNVDLKVQDHVDDMLNIGEVKLAGVLASVEKSFRLLKPRSIFGNNGGDITIDIPFRVGSNVRSCIQLNFNKRKFVVMISMKGNASRVAFLINGVK